MFTEVWRVLTDGEQADQILSAFNTSGGLGETVRRLQLPDTLVGQLRQAIEAALRRAMERDPQAQLVVSAKIASSHGGGAGQSWGFFLVEKPPHEGQPHRIEAFLYRERPPDGHG